MDIVLLLFLRKKQPPCEGNHIASLFNTSTAPGNAE